MNRVVTDQVTLFLALIEQTGIWALRVGFTLAVVIIVLAGVFIWDRRQQFFDRDRNVENDIPVVRNNREEEILFVLERPNAYSAQYFLPSLERMR